MPTTPPVAQAAGKRAQVEAMFDQIAPRYDLLNRLISLGIDRRWRKKAVAWLGEALREEGVVHPAALLDVATGTADMALDALRLQPDRVVGVDISEGMLALGRVKVGRKGLSSKIELVHADSAHLPFADGAFDGALVAFGVRNFENRIEGLREIGRVLRPGGPLVVLELSRPTRFPFRQGYDFYTTHVLPRVGRALSKSDGAYTYLPASIRAFPEGRAFLDEMAQAGFERTALRPLTFGTVTLYRGHASR